jgi:protease secretion system outer membrane protein
LVFGSLALGCVLLPVIVCAQSFDDALAAARGADATYSARVSDVKNRQLQARQAGTAFYPSATVNYSQVDAANSGRASRSINLAQPLLSADKYLQLQGRAPLTTQADAEARLAETDLAQRVFKAMADIVRSRESLRATEVQIDGLEVQYRRAQRMRELGQGTVTEVSDFEVRLAAAQGNRVNLTATLDAARRNFTLITSLVPDIANLSVTAKPGEVPSDQEAMMSLVRQLDPAVVVARQNLEIARLASRRNWAQYLPTLSAQAGYVSVTGGNSTGATRVGIVFSAPLSASTYFEQQTVALAQDKAQQALRAAEEAAVNDAANLLASLRSLEAEIRMRQRAVEAAQQAVEGNLKSYQGGVKSNIDVVTSFQTLADAEVALVNARLSSAEASLRLSFINNLAAAPTH